MIRQTRFRTRPESSNQGNRVMELRSEMIQQQNYFQNF